MHVKRLTKPLLIALLAMALPAWAAEQAAPADALPASLPIGAAPGDDWFVVRSMVRNRTNHPLDATVVSFTETQPELQFGAKVWLPAQSQRLVSYPMRLVGKDARNDATLPIVTLLLEHRGGSERQLSRELGLLPRDRAAFNGSSLTAADIRQLAKLERNFNPPTPAAWREAKRLARLPANDVAALEATGRKNEAAEAAAYAAWQPGGPGLNAELTRAFERIREAMLDGAGAQQQTLLLASPDDADAKALVREVRRQAGLPSRYLVMDSAHLLPPLAAGLDSFTNIVIASDALAPDTAQSEALRQWLVAGGRIWLMLDRADESLARHLLGDDWTAATIDRALIYPSAPGAGSGRPAPAEMVRTVVADVEVFATLDGWPTAWRKRIGRGEFIVTSLSPRGWLDAQTPSSLQTLAKQLYTPPALADAPQEAIALPQLAAAEIGRPVTPRSVVLGTLLVSTLAIAAFGVLAARRRRLDWATGLGVGLSLITTGIMVTIGLRTQHAVPLTVAAVEIVDVSPAGTHAAITGGMAVYAPTTITEPLTGSTHTMVWPDLPPEGKLVRFVISDNGTWQWQGLSFSAGAIAQARYEAVPTLSHPLRAQGTLKPDGLHVQIDSGEFGQMENAQFLGPHGACELTIRDNHNAIAAGPPRALGSETPTTDMRTGMERKFLGMRSDVNTPMLLAWHTGFGPAATWSGVRDTRLRQHALLALPVDIQQPPVEEPFMLPANLVACEPLQVVGGTGKRLGPARLFDATRREWVRVRTPETIYLRFRIPPQATPMRISRAVLHLVIDAPGRDVEIADAAQDNWRPRTRVPSPRRNRPAAIAFEQDTALRMQADGTMLLALRVHEAAADEHWQVFSAALELHGTRTAGPTPTTLPRVYP